MSDRLITDIKKAVYSPTVMPDPIIVAMFNNDLKRTLMLCNEYGLNLYHLDQGMKYISSHVSGLEIKAVLKNWGKL